MIATTELHFNHILLLLTTSLSKKSSLQITELNFSYHLSLKNLLFLKFSRFNITCQKSDCIILYNALTGKVVKIKPSAYSVDNSNLYKLGFVVEDEEDLAQYKYLYYGQMFSFNEINLVIATSLGCNLRCPYCFEGDNKRHQSIDDGTIESILKYLRKHREKPISITWFGGEPMLAHKAIAKISDSLNAESIPFTSSIITNGTILPDSFLSKIDSYQIKSVQITFDGLQASHDAKRFFKNGAGTYNVILENVGRLLNGCHAEIVLKMNVDSANIEEFHKLKRFLENRFSEHINSGRIIITSNYIRKKTDFKGIEKCINCVEYFDFELKNGKKMAMPPLVGPCPLRGRGYFVIGPDGAIYKCMEHLGELEHAIGNINNFSFSIRKESVSCFKHMPFDDPVCRECEILPICGGGCPNERANCAGEERPCPAEKYKINEIISTVYENQ